jgi:hypothetical protein
MEYARLYLVFSGIFHQEFSNYLLKYSIFLKLLEKAAERG